MMPGKTKNVVKKKNPTQTVTKTIVKANQAVTNATKKNQAAVANSSRNQTGTKTNKKNQAGTKTTKKNQASTRTTRNNQGVARTAGTNGVVTRPTSSEASQFEEAMAIDEEEQLMFTQLNTLISGTSQIVKVSPLYNLETTNEAFTKYATQLGKALREQQSKFESKALKSFTCEFMQFPVNSEFLLLTVYEQKRNDENTKQVAFMGLFFSSGSTGIHTKHLRQFKNFLNMPSFLYNGPTRMWRILEAELKTMFSCNFIFHDFKPMNMKYLSAIWIIHAIHSNLIERHNQLKISFSNYQHRLDQAFWHSVIAFEPFVENWRNLLDENTDPRELVKVIWADLTSSLSTNEKVDPSRIIVHKVASKSFVITKEGRFRLRIDDRHYGDVILNIFRDLTRDLERDRAA